MNTFVAAIDEQEARTANNMKARKTSAKACVDLFYNAGALRGKDIVPHFVKAYAENREYALRIAAWLRDIRGGAGERKLFRDILTYLEKNNSADAVLLANKTPVVGRWDDLLVFETAELKDFAFSLIAAGLEYDDTRGLVAKWMPRKGVHAAELRNFLGLSPKAYRKLLVNNTNVVETLMCAKQWDSINFEQVPSLAASRYKKAFNKHAPMLFSAYTTKAVAGEAKVNAAAVYPYDVLKGLSSLGYSIPYKEAELNHIIAQWNALPDYLGDQSVLPLVDVSGSMCCSVGGNVKTTCLDVSVSLGLYCADKNKGPFNGAFLTFSGSPELVKLNGNIVQKAQQMIKSHWTMNTDLHAAFNKILSVAVKNKVAASDMPKTLLILSDMQFDQCVRHDDSAIEMIERKYSAAGYEVPRVVFWNLNAAYGNTPVRFDKEGTALVSGFSPAIMKAIFSDNLKGFTPESIMLETIMKDRYNPFVAA